MMTTRQIPIRHARADGASLTDGDAAFIPAVSSTKRRNNPPRFKLERQPSWIERFVWTASRLSPVLAISAAALTIVLYLSNWPREGNRALQLFLAFALGAALWLIVSGLATRDLTSVSGAGCADTFEELRGRVLAASARLEVLRGTEEAQTWLGKEAIEQADELLCELRSDLQLSVDAELPADPSQVRVDARHGSPYRWPLGHGYVNAWRQVHQAEDLLLAVEPAAVVYGAALTSLDRVLGAKPVTLKQPATRVTNVVAALVSANGKDGADEPTVRSSPSSFEPRLAEFHRERFESAAARAVVRESAFRVHKEQNEAWDKIVNLRNGLYLTFVLTVWLTYALLALVVLQPYELTTELTAATAFFLVGAVVGVFNELWLRSRRNEGTVFDYGLGMFRLIATPVLSGLAALGGVLVTNVLGSYVVDGATPITAIDQIFNLDEYSMGLIVAAIFGLTPGLFFERLNARKGEYDKQIAELSAPSTGSTPTGTTTNGS